MAGKRNARSIKHVKPDVKKDQAAWTGKSVPPQEELKSRRSMNMAGKEGWEFWRGDAWAPTPSTAFKLFLSARLCASLWSGISDCDEIFNYWEPAHFLFKGSGFQTWEYSPLYAIRSYAYILLHVLPIKLMALFSSDNSILMFFMLRCLLGVACAATETIFYRGVCRALGPSIGRLTLVMALFSSAMFISSTALIPSSFSMHLTMAAFGAWFTGQPHIAIMCIAGSAIMGWPFAAVLGAGIAIDVVLIRKRYVFFAKWCGISLAAFLIPLIAIDDHYYGKFVIAPLNIVMYNIFSGHGPELYGVEPFSFYFINGFLNLNVAFVLGMISMPFVLLSSYVLGYNWNKVARMSLTLVPMYLWILIFFTRPHKEERFLFPIYPLFLLAAAMVLDLSQHLLQLMVIRLLRRQVTPPVWPGILVCSVFIVVSLSRIVALHNGYHAPMNIYVELHRMGRENPRFQSLPPTSKLNVCVGKEWYRFTSSFFLPGPNWQLKFLQSEFKGQLPKPYDSSDPYPTRIIPSHMNDLNREEPTRYSSLSDCHFLIDRETDHPTKLEPKYSDLPQWTVIKSSTFLNPEKSDRLFRAFYIPFMSDQHCVYTNYVLMENTAKVDKLLKQR